MFGLGKFAVLFIALDIMFEANHTAKQTAGAIGLFRDGVEVHCSCIWCFISRFAQDCRSEYAGSDGYSRYA
jgi:hypothetical protein